MLSGNRAAALLIFTGLFAATLAGQVDASSTAAAASGQDDSLLSRVAEAAKLRTLTGAHKIAAARKLLQTTFTEGDLEKLISEIYAAMQKNNGKLDVKTFAAKFPYRRSLMGLQDAS